MKYLAKHLLIHQWLCSCCQQQYLITLTHADFTAMSLCQHNYGDSDIHKTSIKLYSWGLSFHSNPYKYILREVYLNLDIVTMQVGAMRIMRWNNHCIYIMWHPSLSGLMVFKSLWWAWTSTQPAGNDHTAGLWYSGSVLVLHRVHQISFQVLIKFEIIIKI